jgi:hypothetical protein
MSNRRTAYIEAFNISPIDRKIRSIKAMEAYGKLGTVYAGVSSKIDSIIEVLEGVYPKEWDIILRRREIKKRNPDNTWEKDVKGNYIYHNPTERPFTLDFVIHYPKITITNTNKEIHTIRDLYVRLTPYTSSRGFTFSNFTGKRMSVTKEEVYSKYQHSHIPSRIYKILETIEQRRNGAFAFRPFCLGESEISQVLTMLSSNYNEGTFRLLLLQLEEYVNWESIEGTPHIHMRNVLGKNGINNISLDTIKGYYEELQRRRPKKEIDFILEGNQVKIVDNDKFEEYLRIWTDSNSYNATILAKKDNKGNYYQYRFFNTEISSTHLSSEEELKTIGFMFRQQRVDFKVITNTNQEEDRTFFLHKQIKEYVTETIEEGIKSARLRSHITKSLNTIESIPENTRQNRLFVPSNK